MESILCVVFKSYKAMTGQVFNIDGRFAIRLIDLVESVQKRCIDVVITVYPSQESLPSKTDSVPNDSCVHLLHCF